MILNEQFLETYVLMCQTITKPTRLKIINHIANREVHVTELHKSLDISMSNLSNHLNALYRAGVLKKSKRGNFVFYSLVEPQLIEGLAKMQNIVKSIISKRDGI